MPDESSEWILDLAAQIGVAALLEGVDKSQLENIAASLESYEDDRQALKVTMVYALRQRERRYLQPQTAQAVFSALRELYDRGYGKNEARQLLGLAKWIYEAAKRERLKPVRNFDEFLNLLSRKGS